jgi:hypothetical protein
LSMLIALLKSLLVLSLRKTDNSFKGPCKI